MLRRLSPLFAVLAAFLLDTAVIPVFYYGRFLVPLTLVVVIEIGIQRGRTQGMLYGLIAGVLLDVSAGTLGMKLFPYVLIGFLIGFFLDQQPEIDRTMDRRERMQRMLVRIIWIVSLLVVFEIVMLIYQYFNTAVFEWIYVRDLFIRVAMMTVLCLAAYPLFHSIFFGTVRAAQDGRATREVKHF